MEEKLPSLRAYLEPGNPGMHTTDTVDFEVALSSEVILELDDGPRRCSARATPWCRTARATAAATGGTEPAVVAVFLIGAHRVST